MLESMKAEEATGEIPSGLAFPKPLPCGRLSPPTAQSEGDMNGMRSPLSGLMVLFFCFVPGFASAEQAPSSPTQAFSGPVPVPPGAEPSQGFTVEGATNAYMALIPPDVRARSDSYFEGGYWLILWDFLYGTAIALLLLNLRWSARMRNVAERITRLRPGQTLIYWAEYLLLTSAIGFPLTVYEGYFREHQYGLATQTFGPWMADQAKGLVVSLILGGIIAVGLFGVVRKVQGSWWIWGALVTILFTVFVVLIAPVYIVPIFNKVTRLSDPRTTQPILSMARASGIPAKDVFEIDASRQTTRMSANVSGFGSTMRITLTDNLLRRGSKEEILAVMGHEMGHYVLNHVYIGIMFLGIVTVAGFALLAFALEGSLTRWGKTWEIRGAGDLAVLPLVVLLASTFLFVLTPLLNTFGRSQEQEADMYGLQASRQPDGFAQAAIHLGEYRKMDPGPLEEWIFFDHPSGHNRILAAMRWKAENLELVREQAAHGGSPPSNPEAPSSDPRS
jgi:STE24 endopeptidase